MTTDLDIPAAEHEIFSSPPLKAMLGQIRFPTMLRIADLPSLVPFQEAIRGDFPVFREEQQLSLVVGPQGPQTSQIQKAYRFVSANRGWSILLTPDAVTLEADITAGYTSYEEFVERFRAVWGTIVDQFAPAEVSRQGLRYVDHIEGHRAAPDWAALINPDLLGPLVAQFGNSITQSASELRLAREEGVLVFKHGMLPLGPEGAPGYLLDFDYFTEEPDNDTSLEAVMGRFDRYHELLYRMFRWCLTDAAVEAFRAAP